MFLLNIALAPFLSTSTQYFRKLSFFLYDKVKLHFVEHGMLVPQGYDLKALEPIGHLGAVFSHLHPLHELKLLKWESYGTLHTV
ncbi:MAG: hypothetical protein ACFWT6_04425 [Virgibacillus proomii]|jgi:hypothetical protein